MLRFTDMEQDYPPQRDAAERRQDFAEIYAPYAPEKTALQAERCSQCGIPFCQIHCPLQNNIPDWLKLAAEGRMQEAYALSSATNNFPEICGRICPQDRLCEGNCVIEKGFGSVTIGAVEKTITETAFAHGWVEAALPARESGYHVGIIGAGPAGLAAADMLRREGHAVTVYDRYDRVGGLLTYGIPNFKLDKSVVQRREKLLRETGIAFMLNTTIGVDISLDALRARHDAVLIATGVYGARALDLLGAVPALDYLIASERRDATHSVAGLHVVVIGGGDTAMDCVRTAVRQQAASVTCVYRRDRANMPGSAREVLNAEQEGVRFEWLSAPIGWQHGMLDVQRMRLSAPDTSGRQSPEPIAGDIARLPADRLIAAPGFDAEDLPTLWNAPNLQRTAQGTLAVDRQLLTSLPNVYAAGDAVRGASLVVWAIKDGREAAAAIHRQLQHRAKDAA